MAVAYESAEVTQHKITFKTDGNEIVDVFLTNDLAWYLTIPERKKIAVRDLIRICETIYTENIIKSQDRIILRVKGSTSIVIYGKDQVREAITEAIFVQVTGGSKK